jgi:hypothetical protein
MKRRAVIIGTCLIWLSPFGQARTITVAPSGGDYASIQTAVDASAAGDIIVVKPGTYNERVNVNVSGTSNNKITLKADPRRQAIMQGFQLYGSHIRIEGFEITNSLGGWNQGQGVFNRGNTGTEVVDNYFHDLNRTTIEGGAGAYIAYNKIYHCQLGITVSSNSVVEYNDVERLYNYGTGDADYSRFGGQNIIFRYNKFHGTLLSEKGSAHVDCWQCFDVNGTISNDVTMENNWCSECNQGLMGEGESYHQSSRITFRNNVFNNCWSWGLCVQEISEITAVHNVFANIGAHGIGISGTYSKNNVIKNNIFYNCNEKSYYFPANSGSVGDYNIIFGGFNPPVSGAHDLLQVNPRFQNPLEGDFHLAPGSPAIDAGVDLGITKDLEDNLRPQGSGPDIGPYEADQIGPNAPTGLNGTPDENSITMTWTAPSTASDGDTASSYLIKRDGVLVGTAISTTFIDKYLTGGTQYSYEVYALDEMGNASQAAATGSFTTTADTKGPAVETVVSQGLTRTQVVFTEKVDQSTAETVGNYQFSGGVTVQSARLLTDGVTVELATSGQTKDQQYTLTVSGVKDVNGHAMAQVQETFKAIFKFRDDFESGNLSLWKPATSSHWQVQDDAGDKSAYINGNASAPVLRIGQSIGTFSIDCDIRGTGTSMQNVCIIFGYQDAQNHYFVNFSAIDHLRLNGIFKMVNGVETKLTSNSQFFTNKDSYVHLRVTRDAGSGEICVYFGSSASPVAQINDKTYTNGDTGIWSKASPAYFDNVEIVDYIRTDPFSSVTAVKSLVPVLLAGDPIWALPNPVSLSTLLQGLPGTKLSIFRADGIAITPYDLRHDGLYLIRIGNQNTVSKVMILK